MREAPSEVDLAIFGNIVNANGDVLKDAWLSVHEGKIVGISLGKPSARATHDAAGRLLLPGFVDAHVHMRSSVDEGITATTYAAAAGGVTTVIDMPFDAPDRPVLTAADLMQKASDVANEALVDVALYATIAPRGDLASIRELAHAGAAGFKVSTLEVDPRRFPRLTDDRLVEAFQEIARTGLPVAAHQENQEIVDGWQRRFGASGGTDPLTHALSRPPVAEAEAAGRLLEFAYWTGARLHMVHGTIPRTFHLINWNRDLGVNATGETCIHYLLLNQEALRSLGGRAKCNPPLRTSEDCASLWPMLEAGEIDFVTSDHSPYPLNRKDTGDIFTAHAGLPGVETLGPLLYSEGVSKGLISMKTFVRALASGPARTFGLAHKGGIQVGLDADIVIFDPAEEWSVSAAHMQTKVGWSPFEGMQVTGKVKSTYVRGKRVFHEGQLVGDPGHGRFVRPSAGPERKADVEESR